MSLQKPAKEVASEESDEPAEKEVKKPTKTVPKRAAAKKAVIEEKDVI